VAAPPDRPAGGRRPRGDVRALVELVRAPAALSVPGDVVAGAAAAGALGRRTPLLALSSVCLYWAGMAANDWADREVDARERPGRPIPSGRVSPPVALGVAGVLSAAGLLIAGLAGGRRALAVAVPLAGAVWAYDLTLKQTVAGPAGMATCRGLDVLMGAAGRRPGRALPAALTVAAHTYTVTMLSRAEVTGAPRRLPAATLAGTVGVAAVPTGGLGRLLAAGYLAGYGGAQWRAAADPSAGHVRAAVGTGITGLPLLQGALTAGAGEGRAGVLVAAAAPLGRRLARLVSPT
jgi:4-hydroxybenzoate polyprenyltransferase